MDIGKRDRQKVIDYLVNKYGSDYVCGIGTVGTLACKAAIKKIGTVVGADYTKMNDFTKLIPDFIEDNPPTLDTILSDNKVRKKVESDPELEWIIQIAKEAESMPQYFGTHAAGVVISNKPLWNYTSTMVDKGNVVSQLTMDEVEKLGLLKVDLLGLRTLDVVQDTIDHVKKNRGLEVDVESLPLNDELTFQLYRDRNVSGVFQVESKLNKNYLTKNKPHSFNCIVEQLALVRPGPLDAKAEDGKISMTDEFFRRKNGLSRVNYPHPLAQDILRSTYGIIAYQEQIMKLSVAMAGFSRGESDQLRKIVGKKQIDKLPAMKGKFVSGCIDKGIEETIAEKVWASIETFGSYGFNLSHSVGYARLSYVTAYLRAHFPIEFTASLLTSVMDNKDKFGMYLEECRRLNIKIAPPDINISSDCFVPVGDIIRFPLRGIKNVGQSATKEIFRVKQEKEITDLKDFILTVDNSKVNKTVVDSLVKTGCFDFLGLSRKKLVGEIEPFLKQYQSYRNKIKTQEKNLEKIDFKPFKSIDDYNKRKQKILDKLESLNEEFDSYSKSAFSNDNSEEYTVHELMDIERELLGFYVSVSPYNWGKPYIDLFFNTTSDEIPLLPRNISVIIGGHITELKSVRTRYDSNMAFGFAEDDCGMYKITIPPKVWSEYKGLKEGNVCLFWGQTNGETEDGLGSLKIDNVKVISDEDLSILNDCLLHYLPNDSCDLTSSNSNDILVEEKVNVMLDVPATEWLRSIGNVFLLPIGDTTVVEIYDCTQETSYVRYTSYPKDYFIDRAFKSKGTLTAF